MDDIISTNQQSILKQIQFYFTPANLLTDEHLLQAIKKSKNHWISFNYLLNCNKIKQSLIKLNIPVHQKKKYIYKLLTKSQSFKLKKYRLKIKYKLKFKLLINNIIYIQLENQNATHNLQNLFSTFINQFHLKINYKKGNLWIFIFVDNQQSKVNDFQKYLRLQGTTLSITRILNGKQWQQQRKSYHQLITKIKSKPKKEIIQPKPTEEYHQNIDDSSQF